MSKSKLRAFRLEFSRKFGMKCAVKDRHLSWAINTLEDGCTLDWTFELVRRCVVNKFFQRERRLNISVGCPADYQLV